MTTPNAIAALMFTGASTRADVWGSFPVWVYLIVLVCGLALMGTAVAMWKSDKT